MSDWTPLTPQEIYQKSLDEAQGEPLVPETRLEYFLNRIAEGGGGTDGDSDFETVTMTVENIPDVPALGGGTIPGDIQVWGVIVSEDTFEYPIFDHLTAENGTHSLLLYKGSGTVAIGYDSELNITGDFTATDIVDDDGYYVEGTYTGDFTISYVDNSGGE